MVCPGCGRSRQRGTVGVRCSCIPEAVWSEPEMVSALERLDVAAVVRLLRFHPSCQGLTLLALSRLTELAELTRPGHPRRVAELAVAPSPT